MADKDLRVNLKADDEITPAAKKAKASLDAIPDKVDVKVEASGLDELSDKVGSLPGTLGEVGGMLGSLGAAGGIGALAAGMFATADAAADLAIEAKTTADLTGATVEEASKLQNLWGRTGADVNDLNDVLLQMNGALAQAPELAGQLGVNLNDGKNITQRFVQLTDKLASGQMSAVEASQLFGEEGVRQVGKLRTMYGGLSDDLENMPAPVDDEDVQQAVEMKNAIADLKATLSATVGIVGKELVPLFGDMATLANTAADAIPGGKEGGGADALKFIREWGTGIGVLAKGAAVLTTGGDDITVSVGNVTRGVHDATDALIVGYAPALDVAAAAQQDLTQAIADGVDEATAYAAAVDAMRDAHRAAADSAFAVRDAQRDFNDALAEWVELTGPESEATMQDLAAAMDETALSAGKVADSQVTLQAEQLKAAGTTQTAKNAQQVWNRSMIESARQAEGPLRDSIVNYIATVNNIPPEKVSEIIADPDYASIAAASVALDRAANDREADVKAQAINIPPTESALNQVARPRTAVITTQLQGQRNLVLPPSVSGAMAPMAAATGPATQAVPVGYAAPSYTIRVPQPTPNITIQTGIMGNRFDSQRVLMKALRAHQRLNGLRE